jgi:hypothetical protein
MLFAFVANAQDSQRRKTERPEKAKTDIEILDIYTVTHPLDGVVDDPDNIVQYTFYLTEESVTDPAYSRLGYTYQYCLYVINESKIDGELHSIQFSDFYVQIDEYGNGLGFLVLGTNGEPRFLYSMVTMEKVYKPIDYFYDYEDLYID